MELLLQANRLPTNPLRKITNTLYFDQADNKMYKLIFFPPITSFDHNEVNTRDIAVLTSYDPHYLAINTLHNNKIQTQSIGSQFSLVSWLKIADLVVKGTQSYYEINKNKVFDFLEKKIDILQKAIRQNKLSSETLQIESQVAQKQISEEVIAIMKSQIDDSDLIDLLCKERFKLIIETKKLMQYDDKSGENVIKKTNKTHSKKEDKPKVDKNQSSLIGFIKSDKKKQ